MNEERRHIQKREEKYEYKLKNEYCWNFFIKGCEKNSLKQKKNEFIKKIL